MNSLDLPELTDAQLDAIAAAAEAKNRKSASVADKLAELTRNMALAHANADPDAFFAAAGTRAGAWWDANGALIALLLGSGVAYALLPKPPVVCCRLPDGRMRRTGAPFPTSPLLRWDVPVADEAALAALLAQGDSAVLAALAAAQPSQ